MFSGRFRSCLARELTEGMFFHSFVGVLTLGSADCLFSFFILLFRLRHAKLEIKAILAIAGNSRAEMNTQSLEVA